MPREAVGPWPTPTHAPGPTPPGSLPEGDTEAMSNAQRSTLKWEKEETLGELATVAPVLYTNINFPNLKEEYPGWYIALKLEGIFSPVCVFYGPVYIVIPVVSAHFWLLFLYWLHYVIQYKPYLVCTLRAADLTTFSIILPRLVYKSEANCKTLEES